MKKAVIIFIALGALYSCKGQTDIKSNAGEIITIDSTLVKSFYIDDNFPKNSIDLITLLEFSIGFNNNDVLDKVSLLKAKEWDDSGDYQKLIIELDHKDSFEIINPDGWSEINQSLKKESLVQSDYIGVYNMDGNYLVLLSGYVYGSGPSFSTLIEFSSNTPRIIYNIKSMFTSIEKKNNVIVLNGYTNDYTFSVKIKEGVIFFKKE